MDLGATSENGYTFAIKELLPGLENRARFGGCWEYEVGSHPDGEVVGDWLFPLTCGWE